MTPELPETTPDQSAAIAGITSILRQIDLVKAGRQRSIKCPFCEEYNMKGVAGETDAGLWVRPLISPFCCDSFAEVAGAIKEAGA